MEENQEKTTDFSKINFLELQQKMEPLKDENLSLLELGSSLEKYNTTNLTETENSVVYLFVRIASICLSDDNSHPFVPLFQFANGTRTCMPEDITPDEMDFFINVIDDVGNKMLKARIADILWYRKYKKKGVRYPEIVVDTYLSIDFNAPKFLDNLRYWKRGLTIAKQIGKKDCLKNFADNALHYLSQTEFERDDCVFEIIELLRSFDLCTDQKDVIIEKAIELGDNLKNENYFLAELYYNEASLWTDSQKQSDEYVKLQIKRIKIYIDEAEKSDTGFMTATHYETALKLLRNLNLNKEKRQQYFSEEQENALICKMKSSGKLALSEMKEYDFSFEIGKLTKYVIDNIKGKDLPLALKGFTTLFCHISFEKLEKNAIDLIRTFPLLSAFGHTLYASDGRIVARTPEINDLNNLSSENFAVWHNMIWQYMNHISIIVQIAILPALQIIRCEHNIQFNDIVRIVQRSNLIPIDRIEVLAKGLYAGFSYDFITALNLLVPQVEHMVRCQLQVAGVKTSVIENSGIEQEAGLSTLIEKEKTKEIFGKDFWFELKALFCDGAGPNLRNNVAHGLLSSDEMQDCYSIYCWWFCFKLVCIDFYNTERIEVKNNI